MKAHVAAVFTATPLPCVLYNNPVAYGTDFLPEQIQELAAEHENLAAVKESSMDVRRVSAIRALLGDRLAICVGVDDAVLEAIAVGAAGWIAGLANALPHESVALFNCGINGETDKAFDIYRWFLPLLRMEMHGFDRLASSWWDRNSSTPGKSSVTRCSPGPRPWRASRCPQENKCWHLKHTSQGGH
jgi:dihydrodipicolinate synthase/N-acetylneuraminate lyase